MTQLERFFRALADQNRLRILSILFHRSLCVCDLQGILDLSQPFISRHLAYLRKAGLVRDRRDGPRVCYSLALEGPLAHPLRIILHETMSFSPALQADLKRLFEASLAGQLKLYARGLDHEIVESRAA